MPALAPTTVVSLAKSAGVDVETIRSYEKLPKPRRQLSDIRRRIADLSRIEAALSPLVAACPRTGASRDCPFVIALSRSN
jgi:hypothetical protein